MRKIITLTMAGAMLGLFTGIAVAGTASLRGEHGLDSGSKAFDKKSIVTQDGGFKRSWNLQPPSIPHRIDKDRINLQENTCMRCHSKETYEAEKAPKVGDSHFFDAAGKMQPAMNSRRYFCTQCHTTQVDAAPLIENTFSD
jgi:cytochrome c-type protein NapB